MASQVLTEEPRESLVVKLARFDRKYSRTMNVVALLGVASVAVAWKGVFDFQNNLFASALATIGVAGVVGRSFVRIAARIRAPFGFVFSIKYLPANPNATSPPRYRFVRPRDDSAKHDLKPYTALSAAVLAIAGAHADLDLNKRNSLYDKWLRINSRSFLSLQGRMWSGRWRTLAVSILLPLTPKGRERFQSGEVDVLRLDEEHIASAAAASDCFLIDTLIVEEQFRAFTDGYGFPGLMIRHVAEFWDGFSDARFLVEPDSAKVTKKILEPLGFTKASGRGDDQPALYEFSYPGQIDGAVLTGLYERLRQNVRACHAWPIHEAM